MFGNPLKKGECPCHLISIKKSIFAGVDVLQELLPPLLLGLTLPATIVQILVQAYQLVPVVDLKNTLQGVVARLLCFEMLSFMLTAFSKQQGCFVFHYVNCLFQACPVAVHVLNQLGHHDLAHPLLSLRVEEPAELLAIQLVVLVGISKLPPPSVPVLHVLQPGAGHPRGVEEGVGVLPEFLPRQQLRLSRVPHTPLVFY